MRGFVKNVLSVIIFMTLGYFTASAQSSATVNIVSGKVTDKDTKAGVQGASVSELDKEGRVLKSVSTDVEGNYVIRISDPRDTITVTHIGYDPMTVAINGRTRINFSLTSQARSQDEVIVISHKRSSNGLNSISERELTTAVGRIDASEMEEMASTSIDQALQGRLAGLDITATSGDPGAAMNIRIRGVSSINSTGTPLIVVDGMPYESEIPSDFNFGAADEQGYAALLNLSPADIKDITVLKDAAATAVWGSKGADGVLVITTKRGAVSTPRIGYNLKVNTSVRPTAIPMLNGNQYSTLIPEAFSNRLGTTLPTTQREFNYDPYDPYWYFNYSNNTNWVDAVSRQGYLHEHSNRRWRVEE